MGKLLLNNYQPIIDNFFSISGDTPIGDIVLFANIMPSYSKNQSLFLKEFYKSGIF